MSLMWREVEFGNVWFGRGHLDAVIVALLLMVDDWHLMDFASCYRYSVNKSLHVPDASSNGVCGNCSAFNGERPLLGSTSYTHAHALGHEREGNLSGFRCGVEVLGLYPKSSLGAAVDRLGRAAIR